MPRKKKQTKQASTEPKSFKEQVLADTRKPKDTKFIAVAIPTKNGLINVALKGFLDILSMSNRSAKDPFYFYELIEPFAYPVEYARNRLVGRFLQETEADYLWFIDADQIPSIPESLSMLGCDADIVSGFYWQWHGSSSKSGIPGLRPIVRNRSKTEGRMTFEGPAEYRDGMDIDVAATGALLIKRKVLEDKSLWQDSKWTDPEGNTFDCLEDQPFAPPIFKNTYKPNGQIALGEDYDFVWRAKTAGYSVKVVASAQFGHLKQVDLSDIARYVARERQAAKREAKKELEAQAQTPMNLNPPVNWRQNQIQGFNNEPGKE